MHSTLTRGGRPRNRRKCNPFLQTINVGARQSVRRRRSTCGKPYAIETGAASGRQIALPPPGITVCRLVGGGLVLVQKMPAEARSVCGRSNRGAVVKTCAGAVTLAARATRKENWRDERHVEDGGERQGAGKKVIHTSLIETHQANCSVVFR